MRDSTFSLGSVFQYSLTRPVRNFILLFRWNFLCISLCPNAWHHHTWPDSISPTSLECIPTDFQWGQDSAVNPFMGSNRLAHLRKNSCTWAPVRVSPSFIPLMCLSAEQGALLSSCSLIWLWGCVAPYYLVFLTGNAAAWLYDLN